MANRLHRLVLAVALTGLAGGVLAQTGSSSTASDAAPPAGGPNGGWHHGRHHGGMMGFWMHSLHDLDLTAAQKEQIHAIFTAARQQHEAERASAGTTMMALADPGNPSYSTALATAKQRAETRIQEGSELQLKVYALLTPAQKVQLTKNVAAHEAKMEQWKAAHANGAAASSN